MTNSELDGLRAEIRELCVRHARGDIREKSFQRVLAERTVGLYRALVKSHMAEGEAILEEHHVILAHTRLTQSVLKEPQQQAISLFATDSRLFRVRSLLLPGRPVSGDDEDATVIDEISFDRIDRLRTCRRIRLGEVLTGLGVMGFAIIFHSWLAITGTLMIGLGMLGLLHGLLLPTRWIEVRPRDPTDKDPILIYTLRRKSSKRLVGLLRQRVAGLTRI